MLSHNLLQNDDKMLSEMQLCMFQGYKVGVAALVWQHWGQSGAHLVSGMQTCQSLLLFNKL